MPVEITAGQRRFIDLHRMGNDYVEEWRHLFGDSTIRARTHRGKVCTAMKHEVDELISAGLMAPGLGGSFVLTEEGRKI